jgi:hypothetical protein
MDSLLTDIEAFCRKHGMAESQFGVLALNDKNFVGQVRNGRDLRISTVDRVLSFMKRVEADAAARSRAA